MCKYVRKDKNELLDLWIINLLGICIGRPWIVHTSRFHILMYVKYVLNGWINYVMCFYKGGKCGCFILINKWCSWVQSALHAVQLFCNLGLTSRFIVMGWILKIIYLSTSWTRAGTGPGRSSKAGQAQAWKLRLIPSLCFILVTYQ